MRQFRQFAQRANPEQMQTLHRTRLEFEHLDRQWFDASVACVRERTRHKFIGSDRRAYGKIEAEQGAMHARDPLLLRAVDAAHVEIRRALTAVVDKRRNGIERIEHILPHRMRARGIVNEHVHAARRCACLQYRLADARTKIVRLHIEFDNTSAIGFIGEHRRFVRRNVVAIAARNGEPEHRNVHAE